VREAGCAATAGDLLDAVVAAVPVSQENALGAFEEVARQGPSAAVGERVGDVVAASFIGCAERPHEARLGLARVVLEDAQPRLVGQHDVALTDDLREASPHRLEQRRRAVEQLVHRRARHGHPLACELLLEPVNGQVVRALGDAEVREEARTVLPLLDDFRGAWGRQHAATTRAAEDLLHVLVPDEARRDVLPDEGALARPHRR